MTYTCGLLCTLVRYIFINLNSNDVLILFLLLFFLYNNTVLRCALPNSSDHSGSLGGGYLRRRRRRRRRLVRQNRIQNFIHEKKILLLYTSNSNNTRCINIHIILIYARVYYYDNVWRLGRLTEIVVVCISINSRRRKGREECRAYYRLFVFEITESPSEIKQLRVVMTVRTTVASDTIK